MSDRPKVHPHIVATGGPDSVTHLICQFSPANPPTWDGSTHHLVPRANGMTCVYCGRLESDLRKELER